MVHGMTITVSQAPSANLAARMTTSAMPVATAPMPLMASFVRLRLALISGRAGRRCFSRSPDFARRVGNTEQEQAENDNDRRQRAMCMPNLRLGKCIDAIADCLHPGHRRAAAGEST